MAVVSEPMAMHPAIACHVMSYISLLIIFCIIEYVTNKKKTWTLISQGTEVTITSPITPCYDVEWLETKTHVGLGPGESIEHTKHRVSLEGHPWPGCRPEVTPGVDIVLDRPSKEGGLNNVGQVNPKDCYLSRKVSALQGGDIQVVKPCKCGKARTSLPPHKCLKWTPHWTMPKKRRCLWWNRLWLQLGTTTPRRSMLMW